MAIVKNPIAISHARNVYRNVYIVDVSVLIFAISKFVLWHQIWTLNA